MIDARIVSIGLLGPGLPNWTEGLRVLDGRSPLRETDVDPPRPEGLGPRERRRTSFGVRLALAVAGEAAEQAGADPRTLPAVFGWAHGDGPVMQRLLETLATPGRHVSPTEFHNSVHNVAAGYWTIASGSHQPSSSIAAGLDTFPATLLKALAEVACEDRSVLTVACGIPFPEPLNTVCPVAASFGVAMLLAPPDGPGGLARLSAAYTARPAGEVTRPRTRGLLALWETNAAARALPLLECIARRRACSISVPYGPKGRLDLAVTPC